MKIILVVLVTLLGFAAAAAEEKQPARKQQQYNPKEVGVDPRKIDPEKKAKWELSEYDAAKSARKAKKQTKGKK